MKISSIIAHLGLGVISEGPVLEAEATGGYASDLLSDVMGNAREGQVWITLQTHKNIIAVASLKDLPAIILVKGMQPDPETIARSMEEKIILLSSSMEAFELSGKLYALLQQK